MIRVRVWAMLGLCEPAFPHQARGYDADLKGGSELRCTSRLLLGPVRVMRILNVFPHSGLDRVGVRILIRCRVRGMAMVRIRLALHLPIFLI